MSTLADVFAVLNEMRTAGVIEDYAVGGATAVLFYAEPSRTYDVDVFVLMPGSTGPVLDLSGLYSWFQERGFVPQAEHVMIHGVPVQLLPAYNTLVVEAVREARELSYGETAVRVVSPAHLVALAIQAGGRRRRERAAMLLEAGCVDRDEVQDVLGRHGLAAEGLLDE